jgi:ribosomal-protein-alanine N-acetyltransferase
MAERLLPTERVRLPLRTERLLLDLPEMQRIPDYVELMNDLRVSRWLARPPFPYRRKDAREFVTGARRRWRAGLSVPLAIYRASDHQLMGGVGLHAPSAGNQSAELGYWLGHPYWGQGYASEAVREVLRVAFGPMKLHRVAAGIFVGNSRSEGVLRKAGFRLEGQCHHAFFRLGKWRDDRLFGLTVDRLPSYLKNPRATGPRKRPT